MPRKLDPMWEYGEPDGVFDRSNLTCKLCGKHMTWGVYWLKFHLAQIPGHEVGLCKNTTTEIICTTLKSLEDIKKTKMNKEALKNQMAGDWVVGDDRESDSSSTSISTVNPTTTSSFFVPTTTPGAQPFIRSTLKKIRKKLTRCLTSVFYGVAFPSAFLGTIHFTSPWLMLFLLLAWGTKSLPMMTWEGVFFKMKRSNALQDWRRTRNHGHRRDALWC